MSNTKELFANNARTSLAGSLTAISTSIVLQTGAGALFPSPNNAIGEFAKATLQDAATGTRNEIVYITARTGDVLTVTRGQDGTSAQVWSAGDTIFEGVTANTLANFTQPSDVQKGAYNYAEAAGTTTAYTATYSPAITSINDGMHIFLDIAAVGTNTTSTPTLAINGLTAWTIVKEGGVAIAVGDMPIHALLQADTASSKWILLNPALKGKLIAIQTFTTTGTSTYTQTAGATYCIAKVQGAGGGSGATSACTAAQMALSNGGGAGAYAESTAIALTGSTTVTVTVGAGGTAGVAGGAAAGTGGTSSFGAFVSCTGGTGGGVGSATTFPAVGAWGTPSVNGTASGSSVAWSTSGVTAQEGVFFALNNGYCSIGGFSYWGLAGAMKFASASYVGNAGQNYGGGASGSLTVPSGAAQNGAAGAQGKVVVFEYA